MKNSKELRIVYMGTPDFAVGPLKALVDAGYHVVGVVTVADKPSGRGLKVSESAVKRYAVDAGIPVLQPEKLKNEDFLAQLRSWTPDLGIVVAFRMLPKEVWSLPGLGTFNLHASLLPQYRGAAPINWAIMNGEKTTGVTTFLLDEKIDTGDILGACEVMITNDESAGSLHDKLMVSGSALVLQTVDQLAAGQLQPIRQSHIPDSEIKPAPKIFRETARIDWNQPTKLIYNKIRGLSPYPAAWTDFEGRYGDLSMKIYRSHMQFENHQEAPGTVRTDGKNELKVATADGYIVIDELQVAGKKRMLAGEFLRGSRVFDDMQLF